MVGYGTNQSLLLYPHNYFARLTHPAKLFIPFVSVYNHMQRVFSFSLLFKVKRGLFSIQKVPKKNIFYS
jgi:hypothetical protein